MRRPILIATLLAATVPATAQYLKNLAVKGQVGEPETWITLTPHRVRPTLTIEFALHDFPLNGATPGIVFETTQDLAAVKLGKTTIEEFWGGLPVSFQPSLEEFKIDGRSIRDAKFSVESWIEYMPALQKLLDQGLKSRTVYPYFGIGYPTQGSKDGEIQCRLVINNSEMIYRTIRSNLAFPFEKKEIRLGLTKAPGIFNFRVLPIDGLTTRVETTIRESVFPNAVVATPKEIPESKQDITIYQRLAPTNFWFFDVIFERRTYEKALIVAIYLLPLLVLGSPDG